MKIMKNTWHQDQKKNAKNRFVPKWNKSTILSIIADMNNGVSIVDIQVQLIKDYNISLFSALLWIKMSKRVLQSINDGLSIDEAIEKDREFRNNARKKK